METFGEWKAIRTLTSWDGYDACACWSLEVLEPGSYMVQVEYACGLDAEGTEWVLETNGKTLTFATLDTGMRLKEKSRRHRMRFRAVEVGLLGLETRGRQTLRLRPKDARPAGDVWISAITIVPWV